MRCGGLLQGYRLGPTFIEPKSSSGGSGLMKGLLFGGVSVILFMAATLTGVRIYHDAKHKTEIEQTRQEQEKTKQEALAAEWARSAAVAMREANAAAQSVKDAEIEKAKIAAEERLKRAKDVEDAKVERAKVDAARAKAQLERARLEQQERDRLRNEELEKERAKQEEEERKQQEEEKRKEQKRKEQEEQKERKRREEEERKRPIPVRAYTLWRTGAKLDGRNVIVTGRATCKVFIDGNATYSFYGKDGALLVQAHQDEGDKDNDGAQLDVEVTGRADSVGKVVYLRDSKVKLKK
jgi:type IV secretory pathway VirB10-like protein